MSPRAAIWGAIARLASRPSVAAWIIRRAQRTPYVPITSRDGTEVYMDRWWLFNPYSKDEAGNAGPARLSWLPSIRVHHIMRADDDGHMHDHPWNARTIVLRGWYHEERLGELGVKAHPDAIDFRVCDDFSIREIFERNTGYTGRVLFNSYHRISEVSPGGVYTLWFTWKYRGTWGFLVDGVKVHYKKYLGL